VTISQIQLKRLPIGRFDRPAALRGPSAVQPECTGVPRWAVVTAGAAPVLLVVGFLVAARLQSVSYDPWRDTISALAARGAADPWVMTAAIAAVGACYLVTALGLSPLRRAGRLALAGGGVATLSIAAFPTPLHGYSGPHAVAVIATTQRTPADVRPQCRGIRGHLRPAHVVHARDQRRRPRARRALRRGCGCALAVPGRVRSSPSFRSR